MKAIGYVRVSTDEQAKEGVSLDNQKARIKSLCNAKDWELMEIYIDEGKSGKDLRREGVQKLIEDTKARKFDVVVIYKVDRISRSQRDLWYLLDDVFEPNGVGFVSVNEPFDTTSAIGKACLGMIGVFAQLERDLISERTKDALQFKKSNGDVLGTPALGFSATRDEIDDELAIVRYVKKLRREGLVLRKIAEILTAEGYQTKRGGKWYAGTVKYLLDNPIYAIV